MAPTMINPVLERETELEQLRTSLEKATAGTGVLVVIEGAAGIGKTMLLRAAFESAAREGILALSARGLERERDLPFGVVRQLFERMLIELDPDARDSLLSGAARLAAPVVAPYEMPDVPVPEASLLHGLYWLVAGLSERAPIVVTVDDVQWSDRASLSFAAYVAQRLDGLPVLLAVTVRSTDPEADSDEVRSLLTAADAVIRPRPLSLTAVTELIRDRLGYAAEDDFCESCHRATGGNPFFVQELLLELESERLAPTAANASAVSYMAPESVSSALLARVRRLSGAAQRLIEAVAVLGDPTELRSAAAVADLEHEVAAEAVDDLVVSGLLEPDRTLTFQHPIVRGAVYGGLAVTRRAEMHAHAARLLAADGAPPDRCAVHLLNTNGQGDPDTVVMLRAAARRSLFRGAAEIAVSYLRRALAEPPVPEARAAIVHELGHAELRAGDSAAVERLELALEQNQDPETRAPIVQDLARALLMSGASDAAIELLDRESAIIRDRDREAGLHLEAESLSVTYVGRGVSAVEPERIEFARALGGETPAERAVLAAIVPPLAATGDTPAAEIAELCERALAKGRLLGELTSEAPQFVLLAQELAFADELGSAGIHLDHGIHDARGRGSPLGFFFCSAMRSMVSYRRGELLDALAFATEAIDVARQHGWIASFPTGAAFFADSLIERGDLDAADAILAEAAPVNEPLSGRSALMFNGIVYRRGALSLARGNAEDAVKTLLDLDERMREIGDLHPARHSWQETLALALSASGDETGARHYARQALEQARRWGTKSSIGIALRTDALVRSESHRVEGLREAAAVLKESPARLEYARVLVDLGASCARAGSRADARDTLRETLDLADRCGAAVLAQRARRELVAVGGRPRRPRATGSQSLTPSERRVAEMAVSGLSNPEIAQSLFLTRKTIETHLGNVYRKLDIHSRDQLADCLR